MSKKKVIRIIKVIAVIWAAWYYAHLIGIFIDIHRHFWDRGYIIGKYGVEGSANVVDTTSDSLPKLILLAASNLILIAFVFFIIDKIKSYAKSR